MEVTPISKAGVSTSSSFLGRPKTSSNTARRVISTPFLGGVTWDPLYALMISSLTSSYLL